MQYWLLALHTLGTIAAILGGAWAMASKLSMLTTKLGMLEKQVEKLESLNMVPVLMVRMEALEKGLDELKREVK